MCLMQCFARMLRVLYVGAEVKSLVSSGGVVASKLDPVDIPVVSSRVTVVKVQMRSGRGHLVLEQHWTVSYC